MDTQLAKVELTILNILLISLKTSPLVKRIGVHVFKQFHVFIQNNPNKLNGG